VGRGAVGERAGQTAALVPRGAAAAAAVEAAAAVVEAAVEEEAFAQPENTSRSYLFFKNAADV